MPTPAPIESVERVESVAMLMQILDCTVQHWDTSSYRLRADARKNAADLCGLVHMLVAEVLVRRAIMDDHFLDIDWRTCKRCKNPWPYAAEDRRHVCKWCRQDAMRVDPLTNEPVW